MATKLLITEWDRIRAEVSVRLEDIKLEEMKNENPFRDKSQWYEYHTKNPFMLSAKLHAWG